MGHRSTRAWCSLFSHTFCALGGLQPLYSHARGSVLFLHTHVNDFQWLTPKDKQLCSWYRDPYSFQNTSHRQPRLHKWVKQAMGSTVPLCFITGGGESAKLNRWGGGGVNHLTSRRWESDSAPTATYFHAPPWNSVGHVLEKMKTERSNVWMNSIHTTFSRKKWQKNVHRNLAPVRGSNPSNWNATRGRT